MGLACWDAHRRAGPWCTRLAAALVPGLAERGEDGHLRSRLVVNEVCESVGRVGVSAGCSISHMRVVVKESSFCDRVRDDGSRVGVPVKAETAAVATVVGLGCVGLGITHNHFA